MELEQIARNIRREIVIMHARANASHIGSALSIVDILTILYFKVMNIDPKNPNFKNRDKFILSKGHASSALYATLAERGFFAKALLESFYMDHGQLPGHLDKESVPGIEVSSGSLGHGLSIGVGFSIANKIDNLDSHVYVLCGDGELNEGSVWEAIMFASHKKLNNLTLIVDYNKLQAFGKTNEVVNLEPLKDKFLAFNWYAIEINGHDFKEIEKALLIKLDKPKAIIAHTIKGKGVSFMENKLEWHYKSPNKEQLQQALYELNDK
ncbi:MULTISPECIES: transketolase [Thermodesulfovibrio]|uniref:Transketolase subunit A n=1 Tax=Thermodesulfovibrio yellowstonii (strain ATCC 51303 / DSM 11347 / YP87) TaxID=289376 RepID=B5YGB8_THEYD|nr:MULTISPECIES: transketolase [Thermodesulfovibrio]ACI21590.1 transketolase subunit A [Thermodesulfovibrio yellowstonii DSM 11347]